ncbi:MAG: TOBE domain-containing protein [Syntrophomonadaceae bacterium]|nr:TOBE domain-containing protein [Syntrophomonadaceae bacterium]
MRISDPNKLAGRILKVKPGRDMAEVQIDIGDQLVTATITASAAKDMNLKKGDEVFAMFDSTSVTVIRDKP